MLIKCGDVSNPVKDFNIYSKWTDRVLEEWRQQGDMERKLGMPISPYMDRDNPNVVLSSQTGFIDFIIVPMFEAVNQGFLNIPVLMQELDKNKSHWQRIKEQKERESREADITSQNTTLPLPLPISISPSTTSHHVNTISVYSSSASTKTGRSLLKSQRRSLAVPSPTIAEDLTSDEHLRPRSSLGDLSTRRESETVEGNGNKL
jgi:hypothetical protein